MRGFGVVMQSRQDLAKADARVRALSGRTLWLLVILGTTVTALFTLTVLKTSFFLTAKPDTVAIGVDFRVFWAAAQLAIQGEPLATFDMARLGTVHNVEPDAWMPWLYPPGYLLLLMPLGGMPFSVAFLVATLLSIALIGMAVRGFVGGSLPVWLAMTLAPAYIPTLILGQNSLLWLAGLVAALWALQKQRWILAGVFIGCLTLKPQLGLLLPVALLAAGLWRTILSAIVTTVVLAVVPTFVFGLEYWPLLVDRLAEQGEGVVLSIENLFLMVGPFYLLGLFGASPEWTILIQWAIIVVSAVIVALLWRSDRVSFDVKAAGLLLAMLLSAPYLWYYEAAMMAVIGLFMVRGGLLGHSIPQMCLLFCLWLGGALQAGNAFLEIVDNRLLGAVLITPILGASMTIVLLHYAAMRHRGPTRA